MNSTNTRKLRSLYLPTSNIVLLFKYLLIVSFPVFLLLSCGGNDNNPWPYNLVSDWQHRELLCVDQKDYLYTPPDFAIDFAAIVKVNNDVRRKIRVVPDVPGADHWQTSRETEARGCGDCEDIAILIWRNLRDIGFPDDLMYLFLVEKAGLFHTFLAVYYSDDKYYVIDPTSCFVKSMISNNEGIAEQKINFIVRFNLFSVKPI